MGQFKNVGEPSLVLMEELAEAIQVIAKKHRFNGAWDETPEGKDKTRWQELQSEMADVFYQWFRLKEQVEGPAEDELGYHEYECYYGTLHKHGDECDCDQYTSVNQADYCDGCCDGSPNLVDHSCC